MSSGPTTWPIDGPPVAPSITFVNLPTASLPAAQVPVPPSPPMPIQTQQPTTLEAQLAAIAAIVPPTQ